MKYYVFYLLGIMNVQLKTLNLGAEVSNVYANACGIKNDFDYEYWLCFVLFYMFGTCSLQV